MKPKHHIFITVGVVLYGLFSQSFATYAATGKKPNILIIVADDMGFSDIGCYGGEIQTPRLDRLAANGLRYTQFYNTTRCWASRAALLTGYYAQSVRRDLLPEVDRGEYGMFGVVSGANGVRPRWAQVLPVYLKPLGYRSYHSGKWHMDGDRLPAGFDRSYSLKDHNRFFGPQMHFKDDVQLPPVELDTGYYSTCYIADHAIRCLKDHAKQHADRPFFEYLCFTAPHFPIQALPEDIAVYKDRYKVGWDVIRRERFARLKKMGIVDGQLSDLEPESYPRWNLTDEEMRTQIHPGEMGRALPWDQLTNEQQDFQARKMAIHAAMVHRMDIEIGRVLDQIKAMGQLDNTIVMFVSDNGASPEQILRGDGHDPQAPLGSSQTYLGIGPGWSTASNTPFRLHKAWTHEGGIITPLIVTWPAGIKARNALRHNPGHLIDIVPTLMEIVGAELPARVAGLSVPPMQGQSLMSDFKQERAAEERVLWWCHDGNRALRVGDWKIVAEYMSPWELYDLSKDRAETNNLAEAHPEKVFELERIWIKKNAEIRALAAQDLPKENNLLAVDSNADPKKVQAPDAAADDGPDYIVAGVKLKLKPGMADEYKRRHDALWPELSQAIRSVGILEFSIFLDDETNTLFAMQKLAADHHAGDLAKLPILHEWWESMVPLMETNPDTSPVRVPLQTMFHHKQVK